MQALEAESIISRADAAIKLAGHGSGEEILHSIDQLMDALTSARGKSQSDADLNEAVKILSEFRDEWVGMSQDVELEESDRDHAIETLDEVRERFERYTPNH